MNNMMNMLMQMMGGRNMNPQQLMGMLSGNPMFQQAQKMMQGKTPEQMKGVINNVAKQKGINEQQLRQMAQQFGLKL